MSERASSKIEALVVEDEALLRLHASDLLEDNGFAVASASNADEALNIMEARPGVRLLFTDVQMPGSMDGLDLAREVHQRWPNILLIVTSANIKLANSELPDDGRFVAKPYSEEDVMSEVKDLIAKKGL